MAGTRIWLPPGVVGQPSTACDPFPRTLNSCPRSRSRPTRFWVNCRVYGSNRRWALCRSVPGSRLVGSDPRAWHRIDPGRGQSLLLSATRPKDIGATLLPHAGVSEAIHESVKRQSGLGGLRDDWKRTICKAGTESLSPLLPHRNTCSRKRNARATYWSLVALAGTYRAILPGPLRDTRFGKRV